MITLAWLAWVRSSCKLATIFMGNTSTIHTEPLARLQTEYKLAHDQSFEFFNDITEREWNMRRAISNNMSHHPSNVDPSFQKENPAEWYQGNWNPDFF